MHTLFYYTGLCVWLVLAAALAWLAVEIGVGFANAISQVRWSLRYAQVHQRPLAWRHFLASFLAMWFDLIGYRNRGKYTVTKRDGASTWHGIGDWTVCPPLQHAGDGPERAAPSSK
jgi:hypothetical protein